jgi:hypothetical protein
MLNFLENQDYIMKIVTNSWDQQKIANFLTLVTPSDRSKIVLHKSADRLPPNPQIEFGIYTTNDVEKAELLQSFLNEGIYKFEVVERAFDGMLSVQVYDVQISMEVIMANMLTLVTYLGDITVKP